MTMKIAADYHIEGDTVADFQTAQAALAAALGATGAPNGGTAGGTAGGGATGATGDASPDPDQWSATKVAATFFPTDYALAAFPSPEESQILVDPDGTYHGEPYLKSAGGAVWKFDRDANGALIPVTSQTGSGFQASCNGSFIKGPDQKPQATIAMMVSQGQIYFTAAGGFIQKTQGVDNPGSGNANTSIPSFFQDPFYAYKQAHGIGTTGGTGATGGTSGGSTGGVPVPPDPPAAAVVPGTSGKTLTFGQGGQFATATLACAAAQPGDTVQYLTSAARGVTFNESFKIPEGVLFDGGGRWPADMSPVMAIFAAGTDYSGLDALYTAGAIFDGAGIPDPSGYAGQMGGVVPVGNAIINGCRILHWGQQETAHGGTAGLRAYGSVNGQIQGSDNYITDCQNGIGPGGTSVISGPWKRIVIIRCGLNDGQGGAHCVYDTSSTTRSIAGPDFYSDGGTLSGSAGHGYKSRATNCFTAVAPFYIKGGDSAALDLPDGSAGVAQIGAGHIEQVAGAANHTLLDYAIESSTNGTAGVKCSGTTFHGSCDSPAIIGNGPVDVTGCVFKGNAVSSTGSVAVTGLPT